MVNKKQGFVWIIRKNILSVQIHYGNFRLLCKEKLYPKANTVVQNAGHILKTLTVLFFLWVWVSPF